MHIHLTRRQSQKENWWKAPKDCKRKLSTTITSGTDGWPADSEHTMWLTAMTRTSGDGCDAPSNTLAQVQRKATSAIIWANSLCKGWLHFQHKQPVPLAFKRPAQGRARAQNERGRKSQAIIEHRTTLSIADCSVFKRSPSCAEGDAASVWP